MGPASAALGGSTGVIPHFRNMTSVAGAGAYATSLTAAELDVETQDGFINGGKGVAWFDFDNDGLEDFLIGGIHKRELYRNNGDATFTETISTTGLGGTSYTMGVATPDLTNDGYPDVVFTCWMNRSEFFLNNGDGTFTNVTSLWNIVINGPTTGIAFGDLDGDGWGDLYIGSYYRRQPYLLKNLEGRGLQDMGDVTGLAALPDQTFQPIIFDYDLDGDLDIFESNDFGPDALYRNEGNWNFTDVSAASGVGIPGDGMGAAIGDLNNDGYMDIFVTNYGEDYWLVFNPATMAYKDVQKAANFSDMNVGWGVQTMDFNNDGFLDIFIADGRVILGQLSEPDKLFINRGDGTFYEAGLMAGVRDFGINKGSAAADYNKDGTLDLFVTNAYENSSLYRNEPTSNRWFEVELHGVVSLRQGVGARVLVEAAGVTQARQVHLGSSYLSQDSLIQHVGLGGATRVDKLTIQWPSGIIQEFLNLSADQRFVVTEDEQNPPVARPTDVMGDAGTPIDLDGTNSTDDIRITEWRWTFSPPYDHVTVTGEHPKITFYEPMNFTGTLTVRDGLGNTDAADFAVVVRPAGHPLVDLGPNLRIAQNDTVDLSATLRGPPQAQDYANITFAWLIEGPGGPWVMAGRNVSHTFVLPGVYRVLVNATNQFDSSGTDELIVTVGDPDPPVLELVPPTSVPEDVPFTLDASRTTDNDPSFPGSGLFYWRVSGPLGQYEVKTGVVAEFTLRDPGPAQFELEVTDAMGNLASKVFVITAIDGTRPRADGGSDRVVSAGSIVRLDASNSSDNDPTLFERGTFEWTFTGPDGPGRAYGPVTEVLVENPGVTEVHLNVRDPSGNTAVPQDIFTITAVDTRAPSLRPLPDLEVTLGEAAAFEAGNVTDNDPAFAQTGVFEWQFRDGTSARTLVGRSVSYTFATAGDHRVTLSVRDAAGNYARGNFSAHVVDRAAPTIVATVTSTARVGEAVEFDATATTDNVAVTTYRWDFNPPNEVATLNGPYVRWTFAHAGNYTVSLTVADAAGNAATRVFHVELTAVEAPPVVNPPAEQPGGGVLPTATDSSALSAIGVGLAAAAALGAVMLFRRWRREQA